MDQIRPWTFWIGPNFKNLLVYTKGLTAVLDKTKYPAKDRSIAREV